MATTFAVRQDDLRRTQFLGRATSPPSGDGPRAVLRVGRFALTSNNITYGALGEALSYWKFFPVAEAGWGCIPSWGFATVESSEVEGVTVGDRYFGYVPMATHVTVEPTKVTEAGFRDAASHRPPTPAIYNSYARYAAVPANSPDLEPATMIFRPLFMTSFVLADFLVDNGYFGAEQVVFSSASSKTAYGTAFALGSPRNVHVVGLTAPKNRAFVERLGLYDAVETYGDVEALRDVRTVYVDLSGDAAVRGALRRRLGAKLVHDCLVGGTHWEARGGEVGTDSGFSGAAPELFLAANQLAKRTTDWGPTGFQTKVTTALHDFLAQATAGETPWVRFVTASGPDAVAHAYDAVVSSQAAPDHAYVLGL